MDSFFFFLSDHTRAVVMSPRSLSVWNSCTPLRLFALHDVCCAAASLSLWISRTHLRSPRSLLSVCITRTGFVRLLRRRPPIRRLSDICEILRLRSTILRVSDIGNLRSSFALFLAHARAPPPLISSCLCSTLHCLQQQLYYVMYIIEVSARYAPFSRTTPATGHLPFVL